MAQIYPDFTEATPQRAGAAPIQTKRVAFTGTGSSQQVSLTWDEAFPGTNYTCVWSVEAAIGSVGNVYEFTKSATGIVAQVVVNNGVSAVLHAVAFYD